MHHTALSGSARLLNAYLFGERVALFIACLGMIVIFWRWALAYFSTIALRRPVVFADQLGAGIWLTAAGMVMSDIVRLALTSFWHGRFDGWPVATAMMSLGVFVIMVGYVWHFRAWAAVSFPALRRLSLYWTIGLALATGAGMAFALGLS